MANTQGSKGTGSTGGMKSDRDRDMTQQSGSGQHSQQSGRMTDANESVGNQGGRTQQSGTGSNRNQQSGSATNTGTSHPNPSKGNTGTSGGQYSGGSGGTGGNDR